LTWINLWIEKLRELIKRLKDRIQERVRPHVTAGRVSAACEAFLVLAWFYDRRS
jgi:hypothetical protein